MKKLIFLLLTIICFSILFAIHISQQNQSQIYLGAKEQLLNNISDNFNKVNINKIDFNLIKPRIMNDGIITVNSYSLYSEGNIDNFAKINYSLQFWINSDQKVATALLFSDCSNSDKMVGSYLLTIGFIKAITNSNISSDEYNNILQQLVQPGYSILYTYNDIIIEKNNIYDKNTNMIIVIARNKNNHIDLMQKFKSHV